MLLVLIYQIYYMLDTDKKVIQVSLFKKRLYKFGLTSIRFIKITMFRFIKYVDKFFI